MVSCMGMEERSGNGHSLAHVGRGIIPGLKNEVNLGDLLLALSIQVASWIAPDVNLGRLGSHSGSETGRDNAKRDKQSRDRRRRSHRSITSRRPIVGRVCA